MKKTEILQLISEVEQQMKCQYKYCIVDPAWRLGRTPWTYSLHPKTMYELARIEDAQGNNCILYIDGCEYFDDNLFFIVKAQNVTNKEGVFEPKYRPEELLSRNEYNTHFWNRRVPFVVQHAICDTLTHFERVKIANAELTIERHWTVSELNQRFGETFNAELRVFKDQKWIKDGDMRIEEIGKVNRDSILVRGIDYVGQVIKCINDAFGLTVKIVDQKHGWDVPDSYLDLIALFQIRDRGIIRAHRKSI